MQPTLMQQDIVLQRVQANHQIRLQRLPTQKLVLVSRHDLIVGIHSLDRTLGENLVAISDTTRHPTVEQMATLRQGSGFDDGGILTSSSADKEDETPVVRYTFYNLGTTTEVSGRLLQADDVYTLSNTIDISLICRIPKLSRMAQMTLASHQKLERDIFWRRRVDDKLIGFIVLGYDGSQVCSSSLDMVVSLEVFCDTSGVWIPRLLLLWRCEVAGEVEGIECGFEGIGLLVMVVY